MARTLRPGHCLDWLPRRKLQTREGKIFNAADNDNHSGFAFDDCINGAHVVLDAVAESSDCLPPLKSAASLLRFIVDLSQRVKTNRSDAEELAQRGIALLFELSQTQDCWNKDSDITFLETFINFLRDALNVVEKLSTRSVFKRLISSEQHTQCLNNLKERMQCLELDFLVISNERQRIQLHKLHRNVKINQFYLKELSRSTTKILEESRSHWRKVYLMIISSTLF